MVGNHHLHVPRRCERPPSWVLHDAPSSGMSLIGCEESADEAGPKELGDTCDTCSARSRDGHAGIRACLLVLAVGTPEFSNLGRISSLYCSVYRESGPSGADPDRVFCKWGLVEFPKRPRN